jgi:LuxR family maltose regulon positive regulatory protein
MAALSLKGVADPSAFIHAFSGSTRFVLDYLVEEVIKSQPTYVQTFLLNTSILKSMNSQICECLVGEEGLVEGEKSQGILEYLERNNLFLIPLDNERNWFRYHHLFGDLLRVKLRQNHPEMESGLHEKAALWFSEHAFHNEAIEHALKAENFSLASDLIEKFALSLITRSEIATVSKWINSLPKEMIRSRPRLLIYQAWVLARMGDTENLENTLQKVEGILNGTSRPPEYEEMRNYVTQFRAYIANLKGDADLAIQVALSPNEQAKGALPPLTDVNYLIGFQLGYAYLTKGDLATAEAIFRSVAAAAEKSNDYYNAIIAQVEVAGIFVILGKLSQAEQLYETTQEWIEKKVNNSSLLDGILKVCRANILYERNELVKADLLVKEGLDHAKLGYRTNTMAQGHVVLAQILRAQGDLTHAQEMVEQVIIFLQSHRTYPRTRQSVMICQLEQWLAEGNISAAKRFISENQPASDPPVFVEELENLALVRVLLQTWEFKKASIILKKLAGAAEAGGRTGRLIKIDVLQALALHGLGKDKEAIHLLQKSLTNALQERYVRAFIDEGGPLIELLHLGKQKGIWVELGLDEYVNLLLVSFKRSEKRPT